MSWRYETCGEGDPVNGGSTYNVIDDYYKGIFGVAFVNYSRGGFNLPKDALEIWIHCWVYHEQNNTSRFRIYNDPNHGDPQGFVTGICLEENTTDCLQAFCNGVNLGRLPTTFSASWYRCWLHMKSDVDDGILEFYMDGNHVYTYTGNVNNGAPFADIYLQSDSDVNLFSDLTISDEYIPYTYDVPCLKMSFYYFHQYLKKGYDFSIVDKSFFRYHDAVISAVHDCINYLKYYEDHEINIINNVLHFKDQLEGNILKTNVLNEEDNKILESRHLLFLKWIDVNTGDIKGKLLSLKKEVLDNYSRLFQLHNEKNMIVKMAEFEAEPRAGFDFLLENIAHIVWDVCDKINFFASNSSYMKIIFDLLNSWNESFINLKTNKKDSFFILCRDSGIDEDVFQIWYADWQRKRIIIEHMFLPIVEFEINNKLSSGETPSLAEQTLGILQVYKDDVDNFYLNERKNIYQKFAFQSGGDLQEKFETESELYKLTEGLQRNLSEIIFSREDPDVRMFLLRWSEPLLNVPIDEIVSFVEERELVAISAEIMEQFVALKRQNFTAYLADSHAYSEALQKREKEYNALVFRMRKDLQKQ